MSQAADILKSLRKLDEFDAVLKKLSEQKEEYRETQEKIESLRALLPTSILGHYDGRKARGKLAIAPVHRGVCGACHLSMASGRLSDLRRKPGELNVCDNCGVFIYLAEDESATGSVLSSDRVPAPKPLKPKRNYAKGP
jgi:predicted  nucleic acid-binding Zn-ribbon protein